MNWSSNPQPTNPWDNLSQDQLLVEWDKLKQILAAAKEQEMEMRKYIVNRAFPDKHEGTNTIELGAGYQLKAGIKYNYKLEDNEKVEAMLHKLSNTGNEGVFIAERLVHWTPSLSLSEYRDLDPKYKVIVDEAIIITDAAPTLEIREPKKKK